MNNEYLNSFEYETLVANDVAIVSFKGEIHFRDNEAHEKCIKEIISLEAHFYILNFNKVSKIDNSGHRFIAMIQKKIREKETCQVLHCYVDDNVWRILNSAGILKESDRKRDIIECIKAIKSSS